MNKNKTFLIIGLGNILLGDEGAGVRVIERINEGCTLPENITTMDAGTAGYKLLDYMGGVDRLILIDAVRGGKPPGTIYRLNYDDIKNQPNIKLSGHQIDLPEVLALAEKLGKLPELVLIGIEPMMIDYGMELSKEVAGSIESVIDVVFREAGL